MSITEKLNAKFEEEKQSEEEYKKYPQELINKGWLQRMRLANGGEVVFVSIPKILIN